jgi:hypothetical protein
MIHIHDKSLLTIVCSEERTYTNYQLLLKLPGFERALDDLDSEQLSEYYKKASYAS